MVSISSVFMKVEKLNFGLKLKRILSIFMSLWLMGKDLIIVHLLDIMLPYVSALAWPHYNLINPIDLVYHGIQIREDKTANRALTRLF